MLPFKVLRYIGKNPVNWIKNYNHLRWFSRDYHEFLRQMKAAGDDHFKFSTKPIFSDKCAEGGIASGHYFHQDLLVARKIYQNAPEKHVDIGSRLDGFVAHVAVFREIEVFDIRPLMSNVKNVKYVVSDLMSYDSRYENYTDSISCLHAIEHFGLGRYNDPIDYNGFYKGLESISLILKPGGKFYFSVPIGPQRIEFNAMRVFDCTFLIDILTQRYNLDTLSVVNDQGDLLEDVALDDSLIAENFNCDYGCGIFELTKL